MVAQEHENLKRRRGWGGARPGSGRKPRLQHQARELFSAAVDANWDTILERMRALADRGDKEMLKYIVDQRIGRASQSVDVTSKGERVSQPSENITAIATRVAQELARLKILDETDY